MRVILYYMGVVKMFALRNSEVSATRGVGLDSIASNVEQSVPKGNVLISERSTSQRVRKSTFHCICTTQFRHAKNIQNTVMQIHFRFIKTRDLRSACIYQ